MQLFARSGIRPGDWMSVPWDGCAAPGGHYSHCNVEMTLALPFTLAAQRSIPLHLMMPLKSSTALAPLTVLSWDIETAAGTAPDDFRFADAARPEDEVVVIAATADRLGSTTRPLRVVLTTIALDVGDSEGMLRLLGSSARACANK
jgi:hypothetical protein